MSRSWTDVIIPHDHSPSAILRSIAIAQANRLTGRDVTPPAHRRSGEEQRIIADHCGSLRIIKESTVFSVEPGIYVRGLAGFRHSDTVVIRAHGAELLTYHPRDLDSMIVRL